MRISMNDLIPVDGADLTQGEAGLEGFEETA
jgi:hypothetical protein